VNLFAEAKKYIAGGVNSPVRAFAAVGGDPVFVKSAKGAWLQTEDGRQMIDYVGSWGPMILGHAHPAVVEAVAEAAASGLSFGAPTVAETRLAQKICEFMPSIERVRMVSSGTEATMSAIRLARGFTGRDKIIKFEGCYHGHSDSLLIKAGSGALTLGVPSSPGVPAGLAEHTITLSFNDTEAVEQAFAELGEQIACVIVEPIAGNMNLVLPESGFLEALRSCCDKSDSVLIFDEVMTGFRVAWGGAQVRFDIKPDISCFGKVMGGGMPVGAIVGKAEIMAISAVTPKRAKLDRVLIGGGTYSCNPLTMVAGLTTLEILHSRQNEIYPALEQMGAQLATGMRDTFEGVGIPVFVNQQGSLVEVHFPKEAGLPLRNMADVVNNTHREQQSEYCTRLRNHGVFLIHGGALSLEHSQSDLEGIIAAHQAVAEEMAEGN